MFYATHSTAGESIERHSKFTLTAAAHTIKKKKFMLTNVGYVEQLYDIISQWPFLDECLSLCVGTFFFVYLTQ